MLKKILNNQSGQLLLAMGLGVVVIAGSLYMWKSVNLSQKSYKRQNEKVELKIIAFNILERTKNALAGKTNCPAGTFNQFRDFRAQQTASSTSSKFNNLNSIPTCLIATEEKAQLAQIDLEITTVEKPNPDILQAGIQISVDITSKDKKSSFRKHQIANLSVASLASFGVMQTSQTMTTPLFKIDQGVNAHIYARTFLRSNANVPLNFIYNENVSYQRPLFLKSQSINLPTNYTSAYLDTVKSRFVGGVRSNIFSQVRDFSTDSSSYWQWDIDSSRLYDGSGYLLPASGMALKEYGATGGNYYTYSKALLNEVNQMQSPQNALGSSFIASTCENSGLQAKTFINMNAARDFIVDFRGSDVLSDRLPLFCGLIMARNLIIKVDDAISVPHMMMGLFFVSGQIRIEGTKGNVYFINPLDQNALPTQLMGLIDKAIQLNQIKNISQLSTNIGKNFTLPIYKSVSNSHPSFAPMTPSSLVNTSGLLAKTNCPTPGKSTHFCWKETVTKPDPLLIFTASGLNNLVFEISDQI